MNRVYVLSIDGRIFSADSHSETFELLDQYDTKTEANSNSSGLRFKKLASCEWGLWAVSSTFQVYLNVFEFDTPCEYQEETYENQRRFNLFSSESFTNKLLFTDRHGYSSADGLVKLDKEDFQLPTDSWTWCTDWNYEQNDSDGWEYAVDFPSNYYPKFYKRSMVRRRHWTRNRRFTKYDQFIHIEGPNEGKECMIDVTCGGWLMPYCPKWFLSVWSISNIGNLYFRNNVSSSNLEGSGWSTVDLPNRKGVYSATCSPTGSLLVVDHFGETYMRLGISRENPAGSGWLHIEQGAIGCGIRQIGLGLNSIWALSNEGNVYFRSGVNVNKPQGTKWIHIPANMSNISVSFTEQLWGIDSNESTLYFRSGISSENASGTGWQKIDLKCKRIHRVATHDQMDKLTDLALTIDKDMNNKNQVSMSPTPSSEAPAEIVRDSQIFIVHRKLEEERPTLVIDDDIDIFNDQDFDSIYSSTESSPSTIQEPLESMNSETMNRRPSSKHYNSLNVDKYLINNDFTNLLRISEESTRTFDDYIEKYKEGEEEVQDIQLKESRTDTMQSVSTEMSETMTTSTLSEYQLEEDEKSIVSSHSYEPGVLGGKDLAVIGFKVCTANNFTLDMKAPNWFNNSKSVVDGKTEEVLVKLNDLKRNVILKDLRIRNIRETCNIDKISVDYENESWSRVEDGFFYGTKMKRCILEIVSGNTKQAKQFNKAFKIMGDNSSLTNIVNVNMIIRSDGRSGRNKAAWEQHLNFKDFILVTCWVLDKKPSLPCLAILTRKETHLFASLSVRLVGDWLTQLAVFCSQVFKVKVADVARMYAKALTITNLDGYAYYAFVRDERVVFMKQIDGHMAAVEKHVSGVTYGVGVNGRLWLLEAERPVELDSYKGPYTQIDERSMYTYENQRWNVLSGTVGNVIAGSDGFTSIRFITDRYNYSDETGKEQRRKEDFQLPSALFKWSTDWEIDFHTPGGVDKEGWQYAFDPYHAIRNPLKDFVRRRRWTRKCKIKTPQTLWKELSQTHRITSLAMDQEKETSQLLPAGTILTWATDSDGFIMAALIDKATPSVFRWHHISSSENFKNISIGVGLRVFGISLSGNVYFRNGVDKKSNYCGTDWQIIEAPSDLRFKQVSVGNIGSVWAVSTLNELYFRKNVTKFVPDGTEWLKVSSKICHVTVNCRNEVLAVTGSDSKEPGLVLCREGVTDQNLMGIAWLKMISIKAQTISNRGTI